jgi:hypothetical protein
MCSIKIISVCQYYDLWFYHFIIVICYNDLFNITYNDSWTQIKIKNK